MHRYFVGVYDIIGETQYSGEIMQDLRTFVAFPDYFLSTSYCAYTLGVF